MYGLYAWKGSSEDFAFWTTFIGFENAIRLERRERDQELVVKLIHQQIDAFLKGTSPVFPIKELDPRKLASERTKNRITYVK